MRAPIDVWKPLGMGAHPLLRAAADMLAFWLLFGGVALASYTSHFAHETGSTLLGLLAVLFTRGYAAAIPAVRLDNRPRPQPEKLPHAALAIYALIGLALVVWIATHGERTITAAILVLVAWAAGVRVLFHGWLRQIKPKTPKPGDVIFQWFDSLMVGHFAFLTGGVALAAYTSGFAGPIVSALLGWLALFFVRRFVRAIPAAQRLIGRWRPPARDDDVKADVLPLWAVAAYALIGFALIGAIAAQGASYSAVLLLFVAWTSGCRVVDYLWRRQTDPETPDAWEAFDDKLDALVATHRAIFDVSRVVLGFVLLSGGVALYAWQTDVTRAAALICGAACRSMPGFDIMAALACGAAAVLFVILYARATLAAQRAFIDPWMYVRPEPKPENPARWTVIGHVLFGFVLLFIMTGAGQMQIPHRMEISADAPEGVGLLLGWWIGGRIVLGLFWARWRRNEAIPHRIASPHASSTP